jgi:hypothetical protein
MSRTVQYKNAKLVSVLISMFLIIGSCHCTIKGICLDWILF